MERPGVSKVSGGVAHECASAGLRELRSPLESVTVIDVGLASVAYNCHLQGEQRMSVQQHAGFYVAGLTARTNNAHEMSGKGKIGDVWQTFLQPNMAVKIPNKIGVDLIAVYTDYETDHTGHYTYLLGVPVVSAESLPAKLTVRHVPGGRYAMFSSERGPVTQVIP